MLSDSVAAAVVAFIDVIGSMDGLAVIIPGCNVCGVENVWLCVCVFLRSAMLLARMIDSNVAYTCRGY